MNEFGRYRHIREGIGPTRLGAGEKAAGSFVNVLVKGQRQDNA
jgi:hypothetical protein